MTWKIARWVIRDVLRGMWMVGYTFLLLLITGAFFVFFDNPSQVLLSLLNVILLVVPLVSLIFTLTYLFNNRNFIVLTLTQPVSRSRIFWGYQIGLGLAQGMAPLIGVGGPLIVELWHQEAYRTTGLWMLLGSILLTQVFLGIGIWLAFRFEDRLQALTIGLFIWILMTFVYDGLILVVVILASAYPVERIAVGLSFLNPLDLVRLLLLMQMDVAALMGFTAAVFKKFLGTVWGTVSAIIALGIWMVVPTLRASIRFKSKDF